MNNTEMNTAKYYNDRIGAVIDQAFILGTERADLQGLDIDTLHSGAPEVKVQGLLSKFEKDFAAELRMLELLHLHPKTYLGRAAQSFFDPVRERYYIADHRSLFFHSLAVAEVGSHLASLFSRKGLLSAAEERDVVARCLLHEALTPFRVPLVVTPDDDEAEPPLTASGLRERIEGALHRRFNFSKKDAALLVHEIDAKSGEDLSTWGRFLTVGSDGIAAVKCDLVSALVRLAEHITFSYGAESPLKGRHFVLAPEQHTFLQSMNPDRAGIYSRMVLVNQKGALSTTTSLVPPIDHVMLGSVFAVKNGLGDALCRGWTQLLGCAVSNPPAAAVLEQLRAPLAKNQKGFWKLVA